MPAPRAQDGRVDFPAEIMSEPRVSAIVVAWWVAMSVIGVANIALWVRCARRLRAEGPELDADDWRARRLLLVLSAVFVFVCAFRGMLPRADVQRITFVDSFWASVFVGRSLATVAELSFAAQMALTVRAMARHLGVRWVEVASH